MAIINEYFGGDGKVRHCDGGTFEAYDSRGKKSESVLIAAELPSLAGALRAIRIHFGHDVPTLEAEQAAEADQAAEAAKAAEESNQGEGATEPATNAIEVNNPAEPEDGTDIESGTDADLDEPMN